MLFGSAKLSPGRSLPQCMQKLACGRCPTAPHESQMRRPIACCMRWADISEVTMPVGTASVPQPSSIMAEAMKRPRSVRGVMSPKPTVVMVVMAQ